MARVISNAAVVGVGSVSTATVVQTQQSGGASEYYTGTYEVTPKADESVVLQTRNKTMIDDVTVKKVPYYETSNLSGGETVYIASEV